MMEEAGIGNPIEQHPKEGATEDQGNPIAPSTAETKVTKHFKQKRPAGHVKGLRNVHFKEQTRRALGIESPSRKLDIAEVIMERMIFDESALVHGHKLVEMGREA